MTLLAWWRDLRGSHGRAAFGIADPSSQCRAVDLSNVRRKRNENLKNSQWVVIWPRQRRRRPWAPIAATGLGAGPIGWRRPALGHRGSPIWPIAICGVLLDSFQRALAARPAVASGAAQSPRVGCGRYGRGHASGMGAPAQKELWAGPLGMQIAVEIMLYHL